jgi:hypothetical protein
MAMTNREHEEDLLLAKFKTQVSLVMRAIHREPFREREILNVYAVIFFDAFKETIRTQGYTDSIFIVLADTPIFGVPPLTEEILGQAKGQNAKGILSVEGFQANNDISDVIYHISLSAPCIGVRGWILKVKLSDRKVLFQREMPYHFDSKDKVKSLGELIKEMER